MNKETLKRAVNIVITIISTALVLVAVFLLLGKIGGGGVYAVLSGSMEPTYRVGSLIYVRPVDYMELREGDAITFAVSENMVATHRIVKITKDETNPSVLWFTTKGDANESNDAAPVHCLNIIGRPVFSIPYLGYAASFLRTSTGKIVAAVIIVILLMLGILPAFSHKKNSCPEGSNA